ncbi:PREDICTED: cell cycle checkpoint control protein RAD9A-like isoform X2 [Priapulus caudatus]|uniref:Cell cycle checkpoint control protein n=1 Tax=Priapulus caudatus TaxID=37621 RepID=A0ABM1EF35_PRICU|nr:PREDICTED: cell cycle checkpoint control protein RAD9A-like isoform X2 [Priapulus caudatus]
MKLIIPGVNLKVFGKAIHSLSKIGEELYFEALDEGLSLRTVNSSRSAYACFTFVPSFFTHYEVGGGGGGDGDDDDDVRCKIVMKSCLSVFRSLSNIERTVDTCKVRLDSNEARLTFQLRCKHGIVKTYNLTYIESEALVAIFSKDLCPNRLTAQSRLLCDAMLNFQTNQEEVILIVNPQKLSLRNYVDDEPDPSKVVQTEVTLAPEEFDNYQVGVDTEVTFCLKELRAILAFTEAVGQPLAAYFETAGKPIVFCIETDPGFEARFVLATLADRASQADNTARSVAAAPSKLANGSTAKKSVRKRPANSSVEGTRSQGLQGRGRHGQGDVRRQIDSTEMRPTPHTNTTHSADVRQTDAGASRSLARGGGDDNRPSSPVISHRHAQQRPGVRGRQRVPRRHEEEAEEHSDEDAEEVVVPGTPPSKKLKSMFLGFSQSTQGTDRSTQATTRQVLAADTDEDDDDD